MADPSARGAWPYIRSAVSLALLMVALAAGGCTMFGPRHDELATRTLPPLETPRLPWSSTEGSNWLVLADSEVRLRGKATMVGQWHCATRDLRGQIWTMASATEVQKLVESSAAAAEAAAAPVPLHGDAEHGAYAHVRVSVASLNCGNNAMEQDLRSALREQDHPYIEYRFERLQGAVAMPRDDSAPDAPDAVLLLQTLGRLRLAGVERPFQMQLKVESLPDGRFRLLGRETVRMTDFDVTPPSAMLGLIQAGDQVEVVFDFLVSPPTAEPAERVE